MHNTICYLEDINTADIVKMYKGVVALQLFSTQFGISVPYSWEFFTRYIVNIVAPDLHILSQVVSNWFFLLLFYVLTVYCILYTSVYSSYFYFVGPAHQKTC